MHSRLVEHLRPDNPLIQAPFLPAPFSLHTPDGLALLNKEVTRQAAMVAYIARFPMDDGGGAAVDAAAAADPRPEAPPAAAARRARHSPRRRRRLSDVG